MIRLKISKKYNFIAQDSNDMIFLFKDSPTLEWDQWNPKGSEDDYRSIYADLDLGPDWTKSLHRLVRNKEGLVIGFDPYTPDPREELKVDDVIWVWSIDRNHKQPRCFHSYSKDLPGVVTFTEGRTSITSIILNECATAYHQHWERVK